MHITRTRSEKDKVEEKCMFKLQAHYLRPTNKAKKQV